MNQNKSSFAPSARTSVFDMGACIIDACCKIVFLLRRTELRPLPLAPETITVQLELPIVLNPSESIARYPVFAFLRYVSIHLGTFCEISAISSPNPNPTD
jgi:hypothetical protein